MGVKKRHGRLAERRGETAAAVAQDQAEAAVGTGGERLSHSGTPCN